MLVGFFGKVVADGERHACAVQVDVGPTHTFKGHLEIRLNPQRERTRGPEVQARGEGTDSEPQGRWLLASPAIDSARIRCIKMIVIFFALDEIARQAGAREQPCLACAYDVKCYRHRYLIHRTSSINPIRYNTIGEGFPVSVRRAVFRAFTPVLLVRVQHASSYTPSRQHLVMHKGTHGISGSHSTSLRCSAEIRCRNNGDTKTTTRIVKSRAA